MTRSNTPLARSSLLRQLKRVNNKSRFRIFQGDLTGAETLFIDEGKLSWGIDKEDVNEQHLQQILAASQHGQETSVTAQNKKTAAAYIPTPDSTGVVADYHERYESHNWRDPINYTHSSQTPEECVESGIANGFTYYMDERDKKWLDKNNEQARGEGTSVFGALSSVAAATRSGSLPLSARQKGKEADTPHPVLMSEDEFELIMGIFEKFTHEKAGSATCSSTQSAIPPFSDFQRTLSFPLDRSLFASLVVPTWVPSPPQVLRIARAVYPWWAERLHERKGHRIIPVVNLDESDTLNESYVCFRKRDVKLARKTRAALSNSCDRLLRLDVELAMVLDTAKSVLAREQCKKNVMSQSEELWKKRVGFVQAKQSLPSSNKADEDLLFDRETTSKRSRNDSKNASRGSQSLSLSAEALVRPRDKLLILQNRMENEIQKRKLKDYNWDDQTDKGYQARPTPYPSRFFRTVTPSVNPSSLQSSEDDAYPHDRSPRSLRVRVGRGGCIRMDRRSVRRSPLASTHHAFGVEDDADDEERTRMQERWRFDADDEPMSGPDGSEEEERTLVDDFDSKFLVSRMLLLTDLDNLVTNTSIPIVQPDGRSQLVTPFKMGTQLCLPMQPTQMQRIVRPDPAPIPVSAQQQTQSSSVTVSGYSLSPGSGDKRSVVPTSSAGVQRGRFDSTTNAEPTQPREGSLLNPSGRVGVSQQTTATAQQLQALVKAQSSVPIRSQASPQTASDTTLAQDSHQISDSAVPTSKPLALEQQPTAPNTSTTSTVPFFKYHLGSGNGYPTMGQTQLTSQQWQHIQATLANLATKDNAIQRYLQSGANDSSGLSAAVQLLNNNGGQNKPMNLKLPLPRQQRELRQGGAAGNVNGHKTQLTSPPPLSSTPLPRRGSSVDDPSHH